MTWRKRVNNISVGDTVQYSKDWLQSTCQHTGDIPRAKGIVTAIMDLGSTKIATIEWNLPDIPAKVNTANLSKVKQRTLE